MKGSNNISFNRTKDEFIHQAHEARQARELARMREISATKIQAFMRGHFARQKVRSETFGELAEIIHDTSHLPQVRKLNVIRKTLHICHPVKDRAKLDVLLRYILGQRSTESKEIKQSDDNTSPVSESSDTSHAIVSRSPTDSQVDHLESKSCDEANAYDVSSSSVPQIKGGHTNNKYELWSSIKSQLMCVCLQYFQDSHSALLDSQHIDLYLQILCLLLSHTKPLFLNNELDGTCKNTEAPESVIAAMPDNVSVSTISKQRAFLKVLSHIIAGKMSSFRNDIKKSILESFTVIIGSLIDFYEWSPTLPDHNLMKKRELVETVMLLLTVPGYLHHIEKYAIKSKQLLDSKGLFLLCIKHLDVGLNCDSIDSTSSLCLVANFIHLATSNEELLNEYRVESVELITKLVISCQKNMIMKKICDKATPLGKHESKKKNGANVSFNPILGWLSSQHSLHLDSSIVKSQLCHLWSHKLLTTLFRELIDFNERSISGSNRTQALNRVSFRDKNCHKIDTASIDRSMSEEQPVSMLKRVVGMAASVVTRSINGSYAKLDTLQSNSRSSKLMTPEAKRISAVCFMFYSALNTFTTMKHDILTNLSLHESVIRNLWLFIKTCGGENSFKMFIDYRMMEPKSIQPGLYILIVFCDCGSHLISILDDTELYERQQPFKIQDLIDISYFLNQFIFKLIIQHLVNPQQNGIDPTLQSTHKFLTDLYKRDSRRNFTPKSHWIIKEVKVSVFLRDLEAQKSTAQSILKLLPHIIPHRERVVIFKKLVSKDKPSNCTGPSTLITIHRSRLVEDGYQQLARLPPNALKGLIRVKFINDHGLDEAGMDQDGVFKEFLEDTIKRVFDPALNLFCLTSEQRLYPSPTSHLHEDHLSLFNFVGKMLGKAVYEGIVVDVPFASFFLSRVLNQHHSDLYSAIDELPSLDAELYKSLTYIKHYEGDVSELELTFSLDQNFMGKLETYELEPGGKSRPVTRENRVRYIHSVANFRMRTQIEKQTEAFVSGFRSIVKIEWLSMFSTSELQRLISGDNTPIDLQDLKKHTKYFGGFHSNHRVICWLWDTLEKDFTVEEHKLFLKFVTSCSKPPLLGFANLEPPFTIRCVEVGDDQDLGDTVGSVLRGFLAIRRSDPVDRLPTSSTCFNLLKLPNYQRRSTLREKLRYAIQSSPGFELS